jgi:hypothetical protein
VRRWGPTGRSVRRRRSRGPGRSWPGSHHATVNGASGRSLAHRCEETARSPRHGTTRRLRDRTKADWSKTVLYVRERIRGLLEGAVGSGNPRRSIGAPAHHPAAQAHGSNTNRDRARMRAEPHATRPFSSPRGAARSSSQALARGAAASFVPRGASQSPLSPARSTGDGQPSRDARRLSASIADPHRGGR